MTTDSALTFVGQIITAYNAAEKAGASALGSALECGKYLNLAKENVEAATPKRKWKAWREEKLPAVSEETERLYRRLAEAVAIREDFFAKCKSIRDAMKHLAEYEVKDGDLVQKPERKKRPSQKSGTGNTVTALEPPETDTPPTGLAAELQHAAADEIISNLQHDTDKIEGLASASISRLSPDKVYDALTKAWTDDQLRELNKRLTARLSTLGTTPPDVSIPSSFRRPLHSQA
jgi:hypothetical protein